MRKQPGISGDSPSDMISEPWRVSPQTASFGLVARGSCRRCTAIGSRAPNPEQKEARGSRSSASSIDEMVFTSVFVPPASSVMPMAGLGTCKPLTDHWLRTQRLNRSEAWAGGISIRESSCVWWMECLLVAAVLGSKDLRRKAAVLCVTIPD